jgi:hypothetical protein
MFTIVLIILVVGILTASLVALQRAVSGAPEGVEDGAGFHQISPAKLDATPGYDEAKSALPIECFHAGLKTD